MNQEVQVETSPKKAPFIKPELESLGSFSEILGDEFGAGPGGGSVPCIPGTPGC